MKFRMRVLLFFIAMLVLSACGGGGGSGSTPAPDNSSWDSMVWDQNNWS